MKKRLAIAAAVSACLFPGLAASQNIYRCGDTYSQQPCAGGKVVQTDDARSASQRADTTQASQRDAKAADAMEKARLKEEAKAAPANVLQPVVKGPEAGEKNAPVMVTPKNVPHFTAIAPKKPGEPKPTTRTKPKKKEA